MLSRCRNPNVTNYRWYGGRGVGVCERWLTFRNFLADMGSRPPDSTLDRIDNNGNYEPGNCRWASQPEQHRNTSKVKKLTYDGATRTMIEWAEQLGLSYTVLRARLRRGWPIERALRVKDMRAERLPRRVAVS